MVLNSPVYYVKKTVNSARHQSKMSLLRQYCTFLGLRKYVLIRGELKKAFTKIGRNYLNKINLNHYNINFT